MTATLPDALSETTRAFVAAPRAADRRRARAAADGARSRRSTPPPGRPIAAVPCAGAADVDRAVAAARAAFATGRTGAR